MFELIFSTCIIRKNCWEFWNNYKVTTKKTDILILLWEVQQVCKWFLHSLNPHLGLSFRSRAAILRCPCSLLRDDWESTGLWATESDRPSGISSVTSFLEHVGNIFSPIKSLTPFICKMRISTAYHMTCSDHKMGLWIKGIKSKCLVTTLKIAVVCDCYLFGGDLYPS